MVLNKLSKKFQGSFKTVSRMLQGYFKIVSSSTCISECGNPNWASSLYILHFTKDLENLKLPGFFLVLVSFPVSQNLELPGFVSVSILELFRSSRSWKPFFVYWMNKNSRIGKFESSGEFLYLLSLYLCKSVHVLYHLIKPLSFSLSLCLFLSQGGGRVST